MKTQNEILTDVYDNTLLSPISSLSGGIYKSKRPTDSVLEDCIINLIGGVNAKFVRDGAISVKIFYPDIVTNSGHFENSIRGQQLEQLLINLSVDLAKLTGYLFHLYTRETYTGPIEEIKQHYAILKINFKTIEQ